ncbi:MAG: hypothetical protein ACOCPN_02695 [Desulfonatronovibrionaceae bacterium]
MKIALKIILFTAGMVLGLVLFFPRHIFWTQVLSYAGQSGPAQVSGQVMDRASWTEVLLRNVHITIHGHSLYFTEMLISLGLNPLIRAELKNADTLLLDVYPSGRITARGGLNLEHVLDQFTASGQIDADLFLVFDSFSRPPRQGELSVKAQELQWPDIPGKLETLDISAKLSKNILQIDQLQGTGDMDFQCAGQVELNWSSPAASAYQVSGTWTLNNSSQDFNQDGHLRDLI